MQRPGSVTTHPLEHKHETLNLIGILSFAEAETAMVGRGETSFELMGFPVGKRR